jgi:hypothetical protein
MTQDKAREVFPIQFFDPGKRPVSPGKDFAIRPTAADVIVPELEPELVAELEATEGADTSEEPAESADPKGLSATESASFSDVIPTLDAVSVEGPVDAEKDPSPPSTEPSKPTSSPTPPSPSGSSEPPVVPVPVTTPSSGSAKPPRRATKPS